MNQNITETLQKIRPSHRPDCLIYYHRLYERQLLGILQLAQLITPSIH